MAECLNTPSVLIATGKLTTGQVITRLRSMGYDHLAAELEAQKSMQPRWHTVTIAPESGIGESLVVRVQAVTPHAALQQAAELYQQET